MVKIAKPTDPKKLAELKYKIHDENYLNTAINRIAHTLSKEIFYAKEEKK
jgi:hypothetical protein